MEKTITDLNIHSHGGWSGGFTGSDLFAVWFSVAGLVSLVIPLYAGWGKGGVEGGEIWPPVLVGIVFLTLGFLCMRSSSKMLAKLQGERLAFIKAYEAETGEQAPQAELLSLGLAMYHGQTKAIIYEAVRLDGEPAGRRIISTLGNGEVVFEAVA